MSEIKLIVALKGKLHALSVRIARLQSRAGDGLDIEVEQIVKLCRETSDMLPSDAAMRVMGSVTSEPRMDSSHRKLSERIAELEAQKAQPPCGADGAVQGADLWCFLRDVLKRGAAIESQFSQQGYETFISEIEAAARKEDGRLRALLASQPAAPVAQDDQPVGWWNGLRKYDERDHTGPSFIAHDPEFKGYRTSHDIPVFAGFNPHSNVMIELNRLREENKHLAAPVAQAGPCRHPDKKIEADLNSAVAIARRFQFTAPVAPATVAVPEVRPLYEVQHCDDPSHGAATGWMLRKNYIDPNGIEGAALLPISDLISAYEQSKRQSQAVPDGVVMAFGLLWHVRMGCDFPVPGGFSRNISPEEAAAKARRFLADLLTREQRGEGINRAAELLAASQRDGGGT